MTSRSSRLEVSAPDGLPEITTDSDLAALIAATTDLTDGDIVVITSKVISKSEGRVRTGSREDAIDEETVRVVARRGPTVIVRNRLGLTMAAAGIDASNVAVGSIVLLPLDPDASARALRARLHELTGANVGVIVTDTAGRAWRDGQTDIAIGAAGLRVAEDFSGHADAYGNDLVVTLPAVADEIAGAADLVRGKLAGRPVAVVRGRPDLVLALDDDGPGAGSLVRAEGLDLFAYGAREAVVRALVGDEEDRLAFGAPVELAELSTVLLRMTGREETSTSSPTLSLDHRSEATLHLSARADERAVGAVCFAHGWRLVGWHRGGSGVAARVSPASP